MGRRVCLANAKRFLFYFISTDHLEGKDIFFLVQSLLVQLSNMLQFSLSNNLWLVAAFFFSHRYHCPGLQPHSVGSAIAQAS